mmetsp:Transcript_1971/g.7188  ORF Transcript_1971/g.7188 Transcript_1971/m.7188 type:complete len:264 (+) Transcript_1971:578-1369(+)
MDSATARRPFVARSRSSLRTLNARYESKPVNGSSQSKNGGSATSSTAMLTRLSSPPERPRSVAEPTFVSNAASKPRSSTSCEKRSKRCFFESRPGGSLKAQAIQSSSRTVRVWKKTSFCITYPSSRVQFASGAAPSTRTPPRNSPLGPSCGRPATTFSSVVLPDPDGPMSASMEPAQTPPETSSRTHRSSGALALACFASLATKQLMRCHSSARARGAFRAPRPSSCSSSKGASRLIENAGRPRERAPPPTRRWVRERGVEPC